MAQLNATIGHFRTLHITVECQVNLPGLTVMCGLLVFDVIRTFTFQNTVTGQRVYIVLGNTQYTKERESWVWSEIQRNDKRKSFVY